MAANNSITTEEPISRRTVVDLITEIGGDAIAGYMLCDIDMSWANDLKERYEQEGQKVTATAILLKAIAIAQLDCPASRSELVGESTVTYQDIVGGFTMERDVDGEPTVFFGEIETPQLKSIPEITNELLALSQNPTDRSRALYLQTMYTHLPGFVRKLIMDIGKRVPMLRLSCQRATFGLTSLGKHRVKYLFCPCICTSTFGIGVIEDRVTVKNGAIEVRSMMTVSLNFNQKVLDPVVAALFMQDVRKLMEGGMATWLEEKTDAPLTNQSTQSSMPPPTIVKSDQKTSLHTPIVDAQSAA